MTDSVWILNFQLVLSHILPHCLQSSESIQPFLLLPKLALHPETALDDSMLRTARKPFCQEPEDILPHWH